MFDFTPRTTAKRVATIGRQLLADGHLEEVPGLNPKPLTETGEAYMNAVKTWSKERCDRLDKHVSDLRQENKYLAQNIEALKVTANLAKDYGLINRLKVLMHASDLLGNLPDLTTLEQECPIGSTIRITDVSQAIDKKLRVTGYRPYSNGYVPVCGDSSLLSLFATYGTYGGVSYKLEKTCETG